MNNAQLIDQFYTKNKELYESSTDPLKCHGPDHHFRTCKLAIQLAEEMEKDGTKVDYEVLIPAAFLHDIAAYESQIAGENHHEIGSQLARQILKEMNYPKDKIEKILEAISDHRSTTEHKEEPIENTLVRDADKIEALDALGCARIIMARTRRGDSLQEIAEQYTNDKLENKFKSIRTPLAQKLALEKYEYSKDFFDRLTSQLKNNRRINV